MKIKTKILLIILTVFTILMISSLISINKLNQVKNEIETLSKIIIPLTNTISTIDMEILKQKNILTHLEVIILNSHNTSLEKASKNKNQIINETLQFEQISTKIETDINKEIEFIKKYKQKILNLDAKVLITTLYNDLNKIQIEHEEFHSHAINLILNQHKMSHSEFYQQSELINIEENQLLLHIETIDKNIKKFVERSGNTVDEHEKKAIQTTIAITIIAAIIGLLASLTLSNQIIKPLLNLVKAIKKVQSGDLSIQIQQKTNDEINTLTTSFNKMISDLNEKEKLQNIFEQYMDPRIIKALMSSNKTTTNKNKSTVSVFFSDIKQFTNMSEKISINDLSSILEQYLSTMSVPIKNQNGIIDKYIGDAIMAFWAPPFTKDGQQSIQACHAALNSVQTLTQLNNELDVIKKYNLSTLLECRIGIATGKAFIGSLGSTYSKTFTTIGNSINKGARLEAVNKTYGTTILVCKNTRDTAKHLFLFRYIDTMTLKGQEKQTTIYELINTHENASNTQQNFVKIFEEGIQYYHNNEWEKSKSYFKQALTIVENDKPSILYLERINKHKDKNRAT